MGEEERDPDYCYTHQKVEPPTPPQPTPEEKK